MDWKKRIRNPLFWITLGSLFLTSTRISPDTLTSWPAVKTALVDVFGNPYLLVTFALAVIGQFNNPTTKGLSDK